MKSTSPVRSFIDAHAHWSSEKLSATDVESWVNESRENHIGGVVLGGVEPAEWEAQKRLRALDPGFFHLTFGVHPWTASRLSREELEVALDSLEREVRSRPTGLVGVGELGLDHSKRFDEGARDRQLRAFDRQLILLRELADEGGPLAGVFHIVHSHSEAQERIEAFWPWRDAGSSPRGIVHSFSGSTDNAKRYHDLGLMPSVSLGVLGRGRGKSFDTLKRTVLELSLTEFVLETDAPDQPPTGEERNHPANLIRLAEWLADWRGQGESAQEILEASTRSVREIFRLP